MGARFLFLLSLLFISDQSAAFFGRSKSTTQVDPRTGLPDEDPLASLEKEEGRADNFQTQDENQRRAVDGEEKVVLDKALEILETINPRVNQALSIAEGSQEIAWQNAKRTNASKSRFSLKKASKVVFDFATNFQRNTSEDLIGSNISAIRFCQGKGDPGQRSLKRRAISTSSFKKTLQTGISLANKTKAAFNLPPLSIRESTCARVKKDFCTNACVKGLCGADALYGAACVWACWGDAALKANKGIQQCHMEFTSRFVHGSVADQVNPCETKKLQRSQSGRIRKLYSNVSGEQETFMIAEACSDAMTKGMSTPPLCQKVLQTCSLESRERKVLLPWMQQFNMSVGSPMAGLGRGVANPFAGAAGYGGVGAMAFTGGVPSMNPMMGMPAMPYGGGMPQAAPMMSPAMMGGRMMPGAGMPYGQQQGYGPQQQMMGTPGMDPSMNSGMNPGMNPGMSSGMGGQNGYDPSADGSGSYDDGSGNYSDPSMGGSDNYDDSGMNNSDDGSSYDDGSGY
jgi:hypothetical protein